MKIVCIGRNYGDHAKELSNPIPEEPLFFLKPDSAIIPNRNPLVIPEWTNDMHYEVEVVVRINRLGKYIEPQFARKYYSEVGIGIDFTARDVQAECKAKGHPWEKAKAFDGSAGIGGDVQNLTFSLNKNGEQVQLGNTGDMLFKVDYLVSYVSRYMSWKMGDLLFTGTPAGVGPVVAGDTLEAFLEDKKLLKVNVR
jgi:2-keto-4-pentenoate hydratase/2-oxohepta-3-ene-1,7-dioic acid hydratase in catechol pathway